MDFKGQFDLSRKAIYYIIVLFVLAFIVIYMNNVIKSSNLRDISNLGKASGNQLVAELITSPSCFTFFDTDIGRSYPGIIDATRLNDETLSGCARFFPDKFSASINGLDLGDKDFSGKQFSRPVLVLEDDILKLKKASFEVQNA